MQEMEQEIPEVRIVDPTEYREKVQREVLQRLQSASDERKSLYITLMHDKETGLLGFAEDKDVANLTQLTFVSAMDIADQIIARNSDQANADHWISWREYSGWHQANSAPMALREMNISGIKMPYANVHSEATLRASVTLASIMTMDHFRNPLK